MGMGIGSLQFSFAQISTLTAQRALWPKTNKTELIVPGLKQLMYAEELKCEAIETLEGWCGYMKRSTQIQPNQTLKQEGMISKCKTKGIVKVAFGMMVEKPTGPKWVEVRNG